LPDDGSVAFGQLTLVLNEDCVPVSGPVIAMPKASAAPSAVMSATSDAASG